MTDFTARYLSDYQVSNFSITTVDLTFELADTATIVTSTMAIKRENKEAKQLVLDGEQLKLISLQIDHQDLPESYYQVSDTQLTLDISADEFTLTIVTEIDPLNNTSLEGLFKSGVTLICYQMAIKLQRVIYRKGNILLVGMTLIQNLVIYLLWLLVILTYLLIPLPPKINAMWQ